MKQGLMVLVLAFSANATSWYCSNAALGSHNGTSWANAWNCAGGVTWGSSGVTAGDTLYVDGGSGSMTYTAAVDNMFTVSASGTSAARITIATGAKSPSPAGHDGTVIFDGASAHAPIINANNAQWIKFDGEKSGTSNWVVQNGRNGHAPGSAYSTGDYAIGLTNASSAQGKILTYFTIHDVSDGINAGAVANGTALLELSYNTIYNVVGDHLINVTGDSSPSFGNILIHHNILTDHVDSAHNNYGPDCIQATTGVDIYNNTFKGQNATDLGVQHPDFIQGPEWNWRIWNNLFDGQGVSGIQAIANAAGNSAARYALFYNNIWTHMGGPSIAWAPDPVASSITLVIVGNTFVDSAYPTTQYAIADNFTQTTAIPTVVIKNNIFYNVGYGSVVQALGLIFSSGQTAGLTFDYNVLNAGLAGSAATLGLPAQAHGQIGAPAFVSYAPFSTSNDYHLASIDTVARQHGTDVSTLMEGSPFSISATLATVDRDGVSRTADGGTWDIGAYEYVSGTATPLNACDLNQDGVVNSSDYILAINMSLGTSPCTANIMGADVCNVVVVQRVANASVPGGTCLTQ